MAVPSFMAIIGELGGTFGLSRSISAAADVSAGGSFCSGNPSALSLAATTTWPIPMKRPWILFWSRQNSNVSDRALFGMGRPGSASIFTINRLRACAGPPMLVDRLWTSGASLLERWLQPAIIQPMKVFKCAASTRRGFLFCPCRAWRSAGSRFPALLSRRDRFHRLSQSSGPPAFAPSLKVQRNATHDNSRFFGDLTPSITNKFPDSCD